MADIEWTHIWQFRVQPLSWPPIRSILRSAHLDKAHDHKQASLFIKIYMEGIPIGRKLNLFAQDGYDSLITTIAHMFPTTILCKYTNFKLYSFSLFLEGNSIFQCYSISKNGTVRICYIQILLTLWNRPRCWSSSLW